MDTRKRTFTEADKRASERLQRLWMAYRKKHPGTSQEKAAQELGFSQSAFSQYLRGQVAIGADATLRMATFLDCHPSAIREEMADVPYGTKSRKQKAAVGIEDLPTEAGEIARAWASLPEDRRACFRDLIFLEAAVRALVPWLQTSHPTRESYKQFERRVEEAWRKLKQEQES